MKLNSVIDIFDCFTWVFFESFLSLNFLLWSLRIEKCFYYIISVEQKFKKKKESFIEVDLISNFFSDHL